MLSIKRLIAIILVFSFAFMATETFTFARPSAKKRPLVSRLRIINNPLNTDSGQNLKISYALSKNARISSSILNGSKPIIILRSRNLQKRGSHNFAWNGRNRQGQTVPKGNYVLQMTVKAIKSRSAWNRKQKVVVTNQLLFSDNFDDRPDGLIASEGQSGKRDPLGKWTVTSGSLYAKNSQGYTNDPVFRVVTQASNFSNFSLSANMLKTKLGIDAWDGLQLFFRYNDPDNLYVAGLRNDNALHLKKKVNGTYFTLASVPIDSNRLNYWYKMTVIAKGNHIEVYVDGQRYIDVYDSSFTTGRVGIRTDNIEAYFDNFVVTSQ